MLTKSGILQWVSGKCLVSGDTTEPNYFLKSTETLNLRLALASWPKLAANGRRVEVSTQVDAAACSVNPLVTFYDGTHPREDTEWSILRANTSAML